MGYALRCVPAVAYVKALDVWLVSCLAFIGLVALEYAAIKVSGTRVALCPQYLFPTIKIEQTKNLNAGSAAQSHHQDREADELVLPAPDAVVQRE